MLYQTLVLSALLIGSFCDVVTFSTQNDFNFGCGSNNEITQIDGSDESTLLHFCFNFDSINGGDYDIDFYDSNNEVVYTVAYSRESDAQNVKISGYINVGAIIDNSASIQDFVMKFEDSNDFVYAQKSISVINILVLSDIVTFSTQNDFDSFCGSNNAITEIDGSDSSTVIYTCFFFVELDAGNYNVDYYNSNDEVVRSSSYLVEGYTQNIRLISILNIGSLIEGSQSIQSFLVKFEDSNNFAYNAKSLTIINAGAQISDLVMRLTLPQSFDDYTSNGNGSYGDNSKVYIESLNQYAFYCGKYSKVSNGYKIEIDYYGLNSGAEESSSSHMIESEHSNEFNHYYCDYEWFYKFGLSNEIIQITSVLYDENDNELDSKTILIEYEVSENGHETTTEPPQQVSTTSKPTTTTTQSVNESGYCQEKPNKHKSACYDQYTQSDCERFNKCEWIYPQ